MQPKKQRKNKSITKDGTGAGTSNNETLTTQIPVQAQTTATTPAEITTAATNTTTETGHEIIKGEEAIIRRGHKTPLATHIKTRITQVIGKTVSAALMTLVMTSKGTQTRYKKADLEYDKQKQFITLPDMTKKETTKRKQQQIRLQEKQPLTKDEWRRKYKFK